MKLRITRPTVKHLFYVYWVMFVQVLHFIVLSLSLDWCFKFIKISYVMSCQAYQMIVGLYWMNSVVIHTCTRTHSDFTCRYHHNYFWPSYKSYKETYEGSWLFFLITVDNIFVQSGEVASRQTRSKTYSDITGVFDKKSNSMAWSLIVKCM